MKSILVSIVAALVLVGCGESQQSPPPAEAESEPSTTKAPDNSIIRAAEEGKIEDLTVIMRVNPTSSDVVGHTRTETGVGDISNLYFYSSGAFSFDEIRIGKTYESVASKEPVASNDIIFYEGFDYEPATQLTNQDEWYKGGRISRRSDNYTIRKGSLTYSDISSSGNRAYAESSEVMSGIGRRIPKNLLENNKGKIFVSFLLQPEVKLHEGIYEGYFVLSLGTNKGKEINFGKGGESKIATKEHYVSELEGGFKRVSSGVKCEIEKTALIVLEIKSRLSKHGSKIRKQVSKSSNTSDKEKALELLFGTNSTITEKDEAFLSAAKKGKLDEVKSLLEEGVDIDCSDAFSCTALFWASANNHISIVEFLIEKGANLNAGAGVGGTPLARSAYEGHVEVVELLLTKGADVNAKDVSGRSPLDSADESVVELLRKHGAK